MSEARATSGVTDVVVVGGGIVGCAVARSAALAGLDVDVVERGEPGGEATRAAGGMLSPLAEADGPGPFLDLGIESLRRYPSFVRAVEEESGCTVDYLECGKLELALDEVSERRRRRHLAWLRERGFAAGWLEPKAVRGREPALAGDLRGALHLEDEAQVDNRRLGPAVAAAAEAAGVRIRTGREVRKVTDEAGRITGVELDEGSRIPASRVVVAAGAWSGRLEGLPRPLPVRPVRGQMLALRPGADTLSAVIDTSRAYLIPRRHGPVVVGSTMEEAGFQAETTAEGIGGLLDAAMDAAPGLARASLVEVWAGLRPGTPDDLPVLGEDPALEGLFYATGHFRNGILLAPVTASCLVPLLTGDGRPPVDLAPFRPDRFDDEKLPSPG